MSDIFISYSRQNTPFARRLIDRLTLEHKDIWVDWEGIPLTAPNWWSEIKAGIDGADSIVFIMSPQSLASVVCHMELDYALDLGKRVIPIVYEEAELSDAFASIADYNPDPAMEDRLEGDTPLHKARDNWQRISHINWLFFRESDDFEQSFRQLVDAVDTDLAYVKAHTRFFTRADEWAQTGQPDDLLLFGAEIDRAEAWLAQGERYAVEANDDTVQVVNPLPQPIQREYISASRRLAQRRRRIVRSTQIAVMVLVLLILGSFALLTQAQQQVISAQSTQFVAQTEVQVVATQVQAAATEVRETQNYADSLRIAARAAELFETGDQTTALQLLVAANRIPNTAPAAPRTLAQLAGFDGLERRFEHAGPVVALRTSEGAITTSTLDGDLTAWADDYSTRTDWDAVEGLRITSVSLSPDGTLAVVGTEDGSLSVWDVASGRILRIFDSKVDRVNVVAFSADGQLVLGGSSDQTVQVWDVATGQRLLVLQHAGAVLSAAFSPDGSQIASGTVDGQLLIWDAATGDLLREFRDNQIPVDSIAFNPDGTGLLASSQDQPFVLWDVATGIATRRYIGQQGAVQTLTFNATGTYVASGSADGSVVLWQVASGEILRTYLGHTGPINVVTFAPTEPLLFSASDDASVIQWQIDTPQELAEQAVAEFDLDDLSCDDRLAFQVPPLCNAQPLQGP